MDEKLRKAQQEMQDEAQHMTVGPGVVVPTKSQAQGAVGGVLIGGIVGAIIGAIIGALLLTTMGMIITIIVGAVAGAVFGGVSGGHLRPRAKIEGSGGDV